MFVCPSVGMRRANGNTNPCTDRNEILHAHTRLSKEGFGSGLTPTPFLNKSYLSISPLAIFKMLSMLQIIPGSAGYLS